MRWPGFIQRFLYGCFGDPDEPIDPGPAPPKKSPVKAHEISSEPAPDTAVQDPQQHDAPGPESSAAASERQQSEQSQSDATQVTTQPTSVESSTKVDSDADEITSTKIVPQSSASAAHTESDPDAITPVKAPQPMYSNVKDALEDRRKLYERLRRKPDGEQSLTGSQQVSEHTPAATTVPSKADGKKLVAEEESGS